jgi:hypothetical protein
MPICPHTGLPIPFCAHCKSGPAHQMTDDNRGYRHEQARRAPIGIPSLSLTISNTLKPMTASSFIGSGTRIETANPRTPWGIEQRQKTFSIICGMKAGMVTKPDDSDPINDILLGRKR